MIPRHQDAVNEKIRRKFYRFCEEMSDFEWQHNWHLEYVADKLQAVVDGEIKRLILTIPFRHGKSQLASRFLPAYFLGRHPDKTVIGTSHSPRLATSMSRDAKRVVMSQRYQELFPNTKLNSKQVATDARYGFKNTSDIWEVVGKRGAYYAFGAGQGIQGIGGDLILIDDVFGKLEDARSDAHRQKIKDWYDNDVSSRLAKDGAIVIINTRMHHDDLIGYLLEVEQSHPGIEEPWEVINFPAIKETDEDPNDPREIGEALWPWRKPVEELEALKAKRPDIFWGPYQGKPSPPGGTIIKEADLQTWQSLPGMKGTWIQSWDLRAGGKSKTSSYAVGQLWFNPASQPANAYLVDQVRDRWDINDTIAEMLRLNDDPIWSRATTKLVENKADGRAVIPILRSTVAGIEPVSPTGDKVGRLQNVAPLFRGMNVFLPPEELAPWVREYTHELTTFPGSANDDQVDATTQALDYLLIPDHEEEDATGLWRVIAKARQQ